MPWSPPRPCGAPGCGALTTTGWCAKHQQPRRSEAGRRSARARGYDTAWDKYRAAFIASNHTCANHPMRPTEVVDHIVPHRGDMRLFWDPANHQPLCRHCHDTKTARGQ